MRPSVGAASLQASKGKKLSRGKLYSASAMTASLGFLLVLGSSIGAAEAVVTNIYTFGDSLVDVGTNNVIFNSNAPKSNFFPYGKSFPFGIATGRFSNGKLVNDFIAQSLSLPLQTPYLQLLPIFHGNDFASAGSGILDSTNSNNGIIPLSTQLSQFQSVVSGLRLFLGASITATSIRNSLFLFSTGNNDMLVYLANPILQATTPQATYISNLVNALASNIQKVIDAGARKVAVTGLGPIGCAPIALAAQAVLKGQFITPTGPVPCVTSFNQAAQQFNSLLLQKIAAFNAAGPAVVLYGNAYDVFSDIIANAASLGFTDTTSACCGAGVFNGLFKCGNGIYVLCPTVTNHIWWDNLHPTERVYQIAATRFLSGTSSSIIPMNIAQLAQLP